MVQPLWNLVRTVEASSSRLPAWSLAFMLAIFAISVSLPAFYLCLALNRGTILLSERLRDLCWIGIFAIGASTLINLPGVFASFTRGANATVLAAPATWTLDHFFTLLLRLCDLGPILPLIALCQSPATTAVPAPASKALRIVTTIAVIGLMLWLAFHLVRLILIPYLVVQLRDQARHAGVVPPTWWALVSQSALTLLSQIGLFVAPFVVWRDLSRPTPPDPDAPARTQSTDPPAQIPVSDDPQESAL